MAQDEIDHALSVFERCDTSIISDALDDYGIDGVVSGLAPVHPDHETTGLARPITFKHVTDPDESNLPYGLLDHFAVGEVFVIDASDNKNVSVWGGMASRLAEAAGLAGSVVNGGYRDAPDIRAGSYPVFGDTPTPKTGQGRMRVVSTDEPVTIQGVTINPGDIVRADATGVVFVPPTDAAAVADTAEDILSEELVLENKIDHGAQVADLKRDTHEF